MCLIEIKPWPWLLTFALLVLAGPRARAQRNRSRCNKDDVHIFMVNGFTLFPHKFGSMRDLVPRIEKLGFRKPRVGSHYWRWKFTREIREIHREDPHARFVLIGYSIGGGAVCSVVKALAKEGICIELVVYIDGQSLVNGLADRPTNVARVVSINSSSPILCGKYHPWEKCYHIDTFWHLKIPKTEECWHIIAGELGAVAH